MLTLELRRRYLLELLTHQTALPVHPPSVARHGDAFARAGNSVTNGPYRLADVVPNDRITLERNPYFHAAAEVAIPQVAFLPTPDLSSAVRRYAAGEIDSLADLPGDQIASLKARFGSEVVLGPLARPLRARGEHPQGALRRRPGPARPLPRHRPRVPGPETLGRDHGPGLRALPAGPRPLPHAARDRRTRGLADRTARTRPGPCWRRPASALAGPCGSNIASTPATTTATPRWPSPTCGAASGSRPASSTPTRRPTSPTCATAATSTWPACPGSPTIPTRRTSCSCWRRQ